MQYFSKIKGYEVKTTKPETIGTVRDIIVDTKTWRIKGLLLVKGLKKEVTFCPMKVVKGIEHGERSISCYHLAQLRTWVDERRRPEDIRLSKLLDRGAMSSDGVEMGHVFDYFINTTNVPWNVSSLIIDAGLMKEVISISATKIDTITDDRVWFKLKNLEIDVEKRNQFQMIENLKDQAIQEKMVVEKKYSSVYSKISDLEKRLHSYHSNELNASEKIENNKETIRDLQKKRKRLEQDHVSTSRLLDNMRDSKKEIQKEMDKKRDQAEQDQQVVSRLQQLGKEIKTKETNIEVTRMMLLRNEKVTKNLIVRVEKLKEEIKEAEAEAKVSRSIYGEIQTDIDKHRKEKDRLKREHIRLERKVLRISDQVYEVLESAAHK